MADDERVAGWTAGLEGGVDVCEAVRRKLEWRVDEKHAVDLNAPVLFWLTCFANAHVDPPRLAADLLERKPLRGLGPAAESPFRNALAGLLVSQPTLPGLDLPDMSGVDPADSSVLASASILDNAGAQALSRLCEDIAKLMSGTEIPLEALRGPGKVLGELAERGEAAPVTHNGKVVAWLVPATEAEQHVADLLKQGRLRRGEPAPIEPIEVDGLERPLSEALSEARDRERT